MTNPQPRWKSAIRNSIHQGCCMNLLKLKHKKYLLIDVQLDGVVRYIKFRSHHVRRYYSLNDTDENNAGTENAGTCNQYFILFLTFSALSQTNFVIRPSFIRHSQMLLIWKNCLVKISSI